MAATAVTALMRFRTWFLPYLVVPQSQCGAVVAAIVLTNDCEFKRFATALLTAMFMTLAASDWDRPIPHHDCLAKRSAHRIKERAIARKIL
jgi:hypothetical protein